jgi:hypothetical protein
VNNMLTGQAADEPRSWLVPAAAGGISLPGCAMFPPAASGGSVMARPRSHDRAQVAVQLPASKKYQDMARIAVNDGGQTGSHPAWDPV